MAASAQPILTAVVPAARAEEIAELLVAAGATAIEERDGTTLTGAGADGAALIAGFADPGRRDAAAAALAAAGVEAIPAEVGDDGWSSGWRAFFEPIVLGRLQIVTPWMAPPRADREAVVIDPGLAFGTGGHATTRLVLEMLEARAPGPGLPEAVLDVGTGSGVLAIAAVKLGARRALGVDIDPESIAAALANAAANGVAREVEARLGGAGDVEGAWPLVLANIELGAFARCSAQIAARVAPGGEALLSGLLVEQVGPCLALWPGFRAVATATADGWAAIALRRAP